MNPSCQVLRKAEAEALLQPSKVHTAGMAERFGGAVKSRDQLVLL